MIARETTEDLLRRSLLELARTRPFKKITVAEIAENCGLSKRTFYNHFQSKTELARYEIDSVVRAPFGEWRAGRLSYEEMQLAIFGEIAENATAIMNICENTYGAGSAYDAMGEATVAVYEEYLREVLGVETLDDRIEFQLRFNCSAYMRAMIDWQHGAFEASAETFTQWCVECLPEGLRPYFLG